MRVRLLDAHTQFSTLGDLEVVGQRLTGDQLAVRLHSRDHRGFGSHRQADAVGDFEPRVPPRLLDRAYDVPRDPLRLQIGRDRRVQYDEPAAGKQRTGLVPVGERGLQRVLAVLQFDAASNYYTLGGNRPV